MAASSSSLTIEELTGGADGTGGRSVVLSGPSLPLMGAEWGGDLKKVTTWYDGNPEATQTVLGAKEMPSAWSGDWRRTMMSRAPALLVDGRGATNPTSSPIALAEALEAIFRSGSQLRVTWYQASTDGDPEGEARIVRVGLAGPWKFKVTRATDIEWEVTFDWAGRGVQAQRAASTRKGSVTSSSQQLRNTIDALVAANTKASHAKDNPRSLTLGQLEAMANAPTVLATAITRKVQQITSDVGQVVNIASTLANQPAHVTAAVVNQAHNCVSQLSSFRDQLDQIPIELQSNRSRADAVLRAASSFARQSQAAADASSSAVDLARQLQLQVLTAPLTGSVDPRRQSGPGAVQAVHVCVEGETPQRVSQRFYKSPDHAVDIMKANRLPLYTPTLRKGQILLIPVLSPTGPGGAGSPGA